jgi:hypothetical protein
MTCCVFSAFSAAGVVRAATAACANVKSCQNPWQDRALTRAEGLACWGQAASSGHACILGCGAVGGWRAWMLAAVLFVSHTYLQKRIALPSQQE